MKKILISLLVFLVISCASSSRVVKEGIFYKTKTYIGVYEESVIFRDPFVNVQTSKYIVTLKENPEIPKGAWCYIRLEFPKWDMHPDLEWQMTTKYFTWAGSEREYRIYSDVNQKIFWKE